MTINECKRNISKGKGIPYKRETKAMVYRSLDAWHEVRAEIEKSAYPLDDLVGKSDMGYVIDLEDVLQIIDKALGEVGEKE